jgi:hypothetical protein
MSNEIDQFRNVTADDSVATAIKVAERFVAAKKGHKNAPAGEAVREIARESRIGQAFIWRLLRPSRRPKSIAVDVWQRLNAAYLKYLRTQLRSLELEIIRVSALVDPADGSAQDLLREAETLVDHIREATRR